jgi:four helix bundle protein
MKKNPKSQNPNPKKIPNGQIPKPIAGWEASAVGEALLLHDGPATRPLRDKPFDMEERTAQFGERIIAFAKRVPRHPTNDRLITQLVGCGTSVGANYHEANEPMSKKDFICCIRRCLKEAKETKFFLRMVVASEPGLAEEARALYRETKELILIFSSMCK